MNNTFRIKQFGRTELALQYSPDISNQSAWKKLKRWINHYPGLMDKLEGLGYTGAEHSFTPAQVTAIVAALGEP